MSESFQQPPRIPPVQSTGQGNALRVQPPMLRPRPAERPGPAGLMRTSASMPAVHFVQERQDSNGGLSMILVLLFLIGAAMAVGPWILHSVSSASLPWMASVVISVCGLALLIV